MRTNRVLDVLFQYACVLDAIVTGKHNGRCGHACACRAPCIRAPLIAPRVDGGETCGRGLARIQVGHVHGAAIGIRAPERAVLPTLPLL